MKLSIENTLDEGIEAHKAGQIQKADTLYTNILNSNPMHPDANHNKGVLMASNGKVEEALPFFEKALKANSGVNTSSKKFSVFGVSLNHHTGETKYNLSDQVTKS